jgi:hypothetical protein
MEISDNNCQDWLELSFRRNVEAVAELLIDAQIEQLCHLRGKVRIIRKAPWYLHSKASVGGYYGKEPASP